MTKYNKNTLSRVDKFFERLSEKYNITISELDCVAYVTQEPVPFSDRLSGEKKVLRIGDHWGDLFDCAWFCFSTKLPEEYAREELALLIDVSGEGLVYDQHDGPVLGLTNGSIAYEYGSIRKHVLPLELCTISDGNLQVWVDAGCNDLFGHYIDSGDLKEAYLVRRLPHMRAFYYDFFVLRDALNNLGADTPRYAAILKALNDSINIIYDFTEAEALAARLVLKKEIEKKGGDPSLTITAIGHAHVDLAWLWPIRETVRKGARTFATVIQMMKRYPDYKFGASQPQLLAWMKDYYPQLFAKIKGLVKEGRFELQGAMWVEADTNLTGGESLVRQIIYGARFWKEEFGVEVDNIWLPDVFGYSGALPQIMQKSGLRYFMTQKLSWNEHNPFPYHTFNWKGIDDSEVLVHMLPEETYNSPASPTSIRLVEKNFHEKGVSDQALVLFGIGDGGGGPGTYHLEKLQRLKNFADFSPVKQRFAKDFFHDIDSNTAEYPTWKGELYFENHRGTLTSEAKNKMYNRRMEQSLRELEFASVLAEKYLGLPYPQEMLDTVWKEVLLYQFHDILPGSSIRRVYVESVARYEILDGEISERIHSVYEQLANGLTAFNSLSFEREEYIKAEGKWYLASLPAMGHAKLTQIAETSPCLLVGEHDLENEHLRVTFAEDGSITSIF
ncbi:MAG: alpha-mannosidase, partial [Gorillibacterium sp.]|nr:alpha-mannosidase [Gorillibacterium sp.]